MRAALPRGRVPAAFDTAATTYDRLVGMNPGYHAGLRRAAAMVPGYGNTLLDAGCGTGASTRALLREVRDARIVALDASSGMLARAARKPWPPGVSFVHRRLEQVPDDVVHGPFDAVFAAYLLRNLPDPDAALATLATLLRPGGALVVHDYSLAERALPHLVWHAACWSVVIPAARVASGDARLYRYLWRSVTAFDTPEQFVRRLRRAGFSRAGFFSARGWQRGITHTFVAQRGPR